MDRIIKFRGWSKDLNKWIYGGLLPDLWQNSETKIYSPMIIDTSLAPDYSDLMDLDLSEMYVVPESVGQFTGLMDQYGNEVWEGDILKYHSGNGLIRVVIYENGSYHSRPFDYKEGDATHPLYFVSISNWGDVEVIGNITENPELLK